VRERSRERGGDWEIGRWGDRETGRIKVCLLLAVLEEGIAEGDHLGFGNGFNRFWKSTYF